MSENGTRRRDAAQKDGRQDGLASGDDGSAGEHDGSAGEQHDARLEAVRQLLTAPQAYASHHLHENGLLQNDAHRLCWEYNPTSYEEQDRRQEILEKLFGTYHKMYVEPDFHCDYGFNIHVHGFALINYGCSILDTSPVNLGANCLLAPGVCLACAGHAIDPAQRLEGVSTSAPITLEDNVWIGANATVCGGVTIGEGSVIGAGSVITHDIPAGVVASGVPCRVMREIGDADRIDPADLAF